MLSTVEYRVPSSLPFCAHAGKPPKVLIFKGLHDCAPWWLAKRPRGPHPPKAAHEIEIANQIAEKYGRNCQSFVVLWMKHGWRCNYWISTALLCSFPSFFWLSRLCTVVSLYPFERTEPLVRASPSTERVPPANTASNFGQPLPQAVRTTSNKKPRCQQNNDYCQ